MTSTNETTTTDPAARPPVLIFRSKSGRTEIARQPDGTLDVHVLTGKDALGASEIGELRRALPPIFEPAAPVAAPWDPTSPQHAVIRAAIDWRKAVNDGGAEQPEVWAVREDLALIEAVDALLHIGEPANPSTV